ncbi:MAG: hypothetical protein LBF36_03460, partial [Mycoplasmataceae bacterium]|nr:hypothetical protein [Mycoplasmataceae bacterium]
MLKISKLLLPIVGSIALPAVVTIPSLSLTLNTTNSNVMATPITNDIPNNTNLGQFQTTPSENELIARIRVNCTNAYYNQIQCS